MALKDYSEELRYTKLMTKSHKENENKDYCRKCNRWHSRYLPHKCLGEE